MVALVSAEVLVQGAERIPKTCSFYARISARPDELLIKLYNRKFESQLVAIVSTSLKDPSQSI